MTWAPSRVVLSSIFHDFKCIWGAFQEVRREEKEGKGRKRGEKGEKRNDKAKKEKKGRKIEVW